MFYFQLFTCNAASETGKPPFRNLEKTVLKDLGSKLKKKIDLDYICDGEGSARCAPGESKRFKESHNYIFFIEPVTLSRLSYC